jgi:hypothetical protein
MFACYPLKGLNGEANYNKLIGALLWVSLYPDLSESVRRSTKAPEGRSYS